MAQRINRSAWKLWDGIEVEGRLLGLPTLFVGDTATPGDVLETARATGIPHILLGTGFLLQHGAEIPVICRDLRGLGAFLTLEVCPTMVPEIPADLRRWAHLIVRVPVPDLRFGLLKPSDAIRLDFGPLHTATAVAQSFTLTEPSDYDADYFVK